MRLSVWLWLAGIAVGQSGPRIQISHTNEALRGVSATSRQVAWASGTHGTYLRTVDGGRSWSPGQIPEAAQLDFRAVVAFSADEAFLMSAGPGEQSRIYHTTDGGQHWQLQLTNLNPKGFFDSMVFWNSKRGIVLGDPIPDEKGRLHFELLETEDGQTWQPIVSPQMPEAVAGEGAFAASNSSIAIVVDERRSGVRNAGDARASVPTAPDPNIWFATGGKAARVFHSPDRGRTWEIYPTPVLHGPESAGIFSIAFRDRRHGVIAGGDYKHPNGDGPNLAFTEDGGQTWSLSTLHPQAYFSAVAYDQQVNAEALRQQNEDQSAKRGGKKLLATPVAPQRLFIVGEDFIFDFRPPNNPRRLNGRHQQGFTFNAVSAYPEGGALVVGPKGTIAYIP